MNGAAADGPRVAIHQPQYFPWPRYLHKVMSADMFVYLDTVQFSKNGLQNRNQVRTNQGAAWLTIPVRHSLSQTILDVPIADGRAMKKHFKTLQANYARTPGFQRWREELQALLTAGEESLCEAAITSTEWMLEKLGVETKRLRASRLGSQELEGSALVAGLCERLGASSYLTGTGALAYMERSAFEAIGCDVWVQEWEPFDYEQGSDGGEFLHDLSTLDLLLNEPDEAAHLIRRAGSWERIWGAGAAPASEAG